MAAPDASDPLIIYGIPYSNYVWAVRWYAHASGIALDYDPQFPGTDVIAGLNPYRKIPVLQHGEKVVFETPAILLYLQEVMHGHDIFPTAMPARLENMQWISALQDKFYTVLVRSYIIENTFMKGANVKKIERALADMPALFAQLDAAFAKTPYLMGDKLYACDYLLMPMLFNISRFAPAPEMIAQYPNLSAGMLKLEEDRHFIATMPDLPS